MATLYRSIDEGMTVDDGNVVSQVVARPGKPTVMASLLLDREANASEHLPVIAEIQPKMTQPSPTGTATTAIQRQPRLPATSPSSSPSSPAEKTAIQEPIPAEGSPKAESESADFDWMGENEWTSLKSFMKGHQKKLAKEASEQKEEPVQRATEDVGRQPSQDKTQAELARRQELARRGQLPRAQVEYLSTGEEPVIGATQPPSPLAAKQVKPLPLEPELSSAEPGAESGLEQIDIPVDDSAPIPAQPPPVVQRTQAGTSSPTPDSRSTPDPGAMDAPSDLEPANATAVSGQDDPDTAVGTPEVLSKPSSPEIEEVPVVQRAPEVASGSLETGDRPDSEAKSDALSPEDKGRAGFRNRLLAAAKSLFRGDDDSEESIPSETDFESDVTADVEARALPGQEVIQRAPVEDFPKSPSVGHDLSSKPIDDVESPVILTDASDQVLSPAPKIDPKQDQGLDSVVDTLAGAEKAPEFSAPAEAESTADISATEVPGLSGDQPALDLSKTGPTGETSPDISRKPAETTDAAPGARLPAAEWQPKVEPTQVPESVGTAVTDEPIISESTRPVTSGDEVDTVIQEPQVAGLEEQPHMLQRKKVKETSPSPEMNGLTGKAEPSISEPADLADGRDEVDTVNQRTDASIELRDVGEERQESPQKPVEPDFPPAFETELSARPTQALPLDAVWPVEKTEAPTIVPPPVKQRDVSSSRPAVQRKPAGDDTVGGKLHSALKDVVPGRSTDSSIELVTPRRPRPIPSARPQSPIANVQRKQTETKPPTTADSLPPADQAAVGEKESPYLVPTEVGNLPSDLWEYLGEKPPPPSSKRRSSQDTVGDRSPPDLQRAVEPSKPLVTKEFLSADVQRDESTQDRRAGGSDDAGDSGETEDESANQQELDINELARQVFPEIKRRLNVDWERGRGRF